MRLREKNGGIRMAAFFASFGTYVIKLIFFAIVAVAGIFVGKKLRDRKDAKTASEESDAKIKE